MNSTEHPKDNAYIEPLLINASDVKELDKPDKPKRRKSVDTHCPEDKKLNAWTPEDERMVYIRSCVTNRWTFTLMCYWLYISFTFYFDVIVLIGVVYYLDVALDGNAIWIFYLQEEYKYVAINVAAIFLANLWAAIDMFQAVPAEERYWPSHIGLGGSVLIVGYLIPCFMHIAFLVYVSLSIGKKHPLLLCAKLAESVLEASISSMVQVYALLFSTWVDWNAWIQISLSACSSFLSIGYAFTCFDRQDIGLNGIPGKERGVSLTLLLVYVFRCAEVGSRISSLAIFCIATRGHLQVHKLIQMPEIFETLVETIMITGGPMIIAFDMMVLVVLTLIYQWRNPANLRFALPSFLCFMNPILERDNPVTVPVFVYFSWRWIQLLAMGGISYYLTGSVDKLIDVVHKDEQDFVIALFCAITTALWTLLLPLIRCTQAKHVLYSYTADMLSEKEFNKSQESLRDNILRLAHREGQESSYALIGPVSGQHGGSAPNEGTLLAEEFQRRSRDFLTEAIRRLKDASESSSQAAKGKKSKSPATGDTLSEATPHQERPRCMGGLYDWASKLLVEYEQKKRQREKIDEIFARVLCLSANIIPHQRTPTAHWESSVGKRDYATVLKQLHSSLASDRTGTLQQKALEHLTMFREKLLPSWLQWEDSDADRDLYRLKCQILLILGKKGWETKAHGFTREAKKLHACLEAYPKSELPQMKGPNLEYCLQEQMKVLVSLWHCVPDKANYDGLHELFSGREFLAMSDGANVRLTKLSEAQKASVDCDDLPSYCATFVEAMGELELFDLLPEKQGYAARAKKTFEEIKKSIVSSIVKKIDELNTAFEDSQQTSDQDNEKTFEKMTKALAAMKDFEKKLNRPDKNTRKPRFDWCEDVITDIKERISKGELDIANFKKGVEEQKAKKEEELIQTKAEAEEAKEAAEELEEELEEATREKAELERIVQEKDQKELLLKRAAHRKERLQKMKVKELKKKARRVKVQKTNGLVLAVNCNEDLDAFAEFVGDDDGEPMVKHVANWLHVPEAAVHLEDGFRMQGSLVVDIQCSDTDETERVWTTLEEYESDDKTLRNPYGLVVRVTAVQRSAELFTLRFEGDVGQLLRDDLVREDILEEISVQLGAPIDDSNEVLKFKDESIILNGTMTVFFLVAVHTVLYKQIQESADEADPLDLPGIVCSLSVAEDESLEEASDDLSSIGESISASEFKVGVDRIDEGDEDLESNSS